MRRAHVKTGMLKKRAPYWQMLVTIITAATAGATTKTTYAPAESPMSFLCKA
jgi:hypothetical protein